MTRTLTVTIGRSSDEWSYSYKTCRVQVLRDKSTETVHDSMTNTKNNTRRRVSLFSWS
jgi:hypothetical protein